MEDDDEEHTENNDDDEDWAPKTVKEAPRKARKSAESSTSQSIGAPTRKVLRMSDFDESSSEDEISMLPRSPTKKGGRALRAKPRVVLSDDEEDEEIALPTPRQPKKSTGLESKLKSVSLYDDESDKDEVVPVEGGKKKKR
ncbi:hypothetical protein NEOLEDRAFT_1136035 [Neolentinus lepideus HHB14362 ss-1]|uniref:Uncharacterized protein n=1 Tax=Neolentinus lepideus HHB14362 ss-1 TaxID=1314782 RepID=A0A165RID5_9AGAM|nr:hypothetical protein NEOLEDRAFT_1136035 [Neolentinus lepideus HHB14362 ss-1]